MLLASGAMVTEILATNVFAPPTRTQLDAWINRFNLRVTTVMDPPAAMRTATLDTYGIRETVFLVQLSTMRIVRRYNGSVAGVGTSAVGQAIAELLRLQSM